MKYKLYSLLASLLIGIPACGSPTDIADSPTAVTKDAVRFQASVRKGERYPNEFVIDVEFHNTSGASRVVTWGGCGIQARLFRGGNEVNISSPPPTACDDYLATASLSPNETRRAQESIVPNPAKQYSGPYQIIVVFTGKIDGSNVKLTVAAGEFQF